MNQGRDQLMPILISDPFAAAGGCRGECAPALTRVPTRRGRRPEGPVALAGAGSAPRWSRPRRISSRSRVLSPLEILPEAALNAPVPRIPEGIPEEHGLSLGALGVLLNAYHRTLPPALREEYVRQVMKFAGEKAGQLIRSQLQGP